jgi:UPF0755 protein
MPLYSSRKNIFPNRFTLVSGGIVIFAVATILVYLFGFRSPVDFPAARQVEVPNGKGLSEIAQILKDDKVIRSTFWFTNFVILFEHETSVVGGQYYFDQPLNIYEIAKRVSRGTFNMSQLRTTIPEGSNIFDIAMIVKKNYPDFDTVHFLTLAKDKEGYLFPDTYYFGAQVTPEAVVEAMNSTFNRRIQQKKFKWPLPPPLGRLMKLLKWLR